MAQDLLQAGDVATRPEVGSSSSTVALIGGLEDFPSGFVGQNLHGLKR